MERKCLDCCSEHIFFQVLRQLFRWLHNMHKWANGKDEAFTTVYTNLCTPVLAFLFPICCVKLCLSGCFSGGWKKWKMLSNWRISSGLSWTVRAHHIQGRKTLPKQFIWSLTEEATQPSGGVASPQHWLWMIAVETSLTPRFLLTEDALTISGDSWAQFLHLLASRKALKSFLVTTVPHD